MMGSTHFRNGKFEAKYGHNGRTHFLGRFDTEEAAKDAIVLHLASSQDHIGKKKCPVCGCVFFVRSVNRNRRLCRSCRKEQYVAATVRFLEFYGRPGYG